LRRARDAARAAQERGVLVRAAKVRAAEAIAVQESADALSASSARFREAAAGCEELLAHEIQRIAPAGLKIRGGRLWAQNSRGETVLFDELSFGERLKLILPLAIQAVGNGGAMVLPQEAYEGLDPINREMIEEILRAYGVHIITAACDGGELRVEPLNGSSGEIHQ
jgi:hypothetical protein